LAIKKKKKYRRETIHLGGKRGKKGGKKKREAFFEGKGGKEPSRGNIMINGEEIRSETKEKSD